MLLLVTSSSWYSTPVTDQNKRDEAQYCSLKQKTTRGLLETSAILKAVEVSVA